MQRKIKVVEQVLEIYPKYQPEVGKVYVAEYARIGRLNKEIAVIDILDKKICLREGEFELLEE